LATIINHPLALHKLTVMRDEGTSTQDFRRLLREVGALLAYEATRDLPLTERAINTPMGPMNAPVIAGKKLCIAPVLRAGLGLVDGMLDAIPAARIAHIGLYRDHETLEPVRYYFNTPEAMTKRMAIVADPMLATAGSAIAAVNYMKDAGAASVRVAALLAAPEGIAALEAAHPDVPVFVIAVDERLNDKGYILPGLGDAGDRQFGTA
jgi:uracil phosphoribosyltransferase